jgi:hypothetical protein
MGERGADKGQRTLPMQFRAGYFGGEDVVTESFMFLTRHFSTMLLLSALPSIIRQRVLRYRPEA